MPHNVNIYLIKNKKTGSITTTWIPYYFEDFFDKPQNSMNQYYWAPMDQIDKHMKYYQSRNCYKFLRKMAKKAKHGYQPWSNKTDNEIWEAIFDEVEVIEVQMTIGNTIRNLDTQEYFPQRVSTL